jgi:hypothetical protein
MDKENHMKEQPTHEEKRRTLEGQETGWGYWLTAPPVPTGHWSYDDWIRFIGNRWYRKNSIKAQEQKT